MKTDSTFQIRSEKKEIDKFRKFVVSRHGSLNGFFWKELKTAMREHREIEACTHTQKHRKISKIRNPRLVLILNFLNNWKKDHISMVEFDNWMTKSIGRDRRTKKGYLMDINALKYLTPHPKRANAYALNKARIEYAVKQSEENKG